jgi:hypothetical protein
MRSNTLWGCFWPSRTGLGGFRKIELRPGFDLYISDCQVKESFTTHFERHRPAFGFGYWVSGKTIGSAVGTPPKLYDKQGTTKIFYYPDLSGSVKDLKNSYRRSVSLIVESELLHSLLGGTLDHIPKSFRTFLEGSIQGEYRSDGRIAARISQVLDQLFHCSFNGATRRLFFESKAMELIALRLEQMTLSKFLQQVSTYP